MPPTRSRRSLLALAAFVLLSSSAASAQENIDAGKSASKLFAETCATCHRSAKGLAKDRFSLTLYLYLQKHYASNSSSAWALTAYLESVDSARRAPTRAAAAKPAPAHAPQTSGPPSSTWTSRSSLRPPAAIPNR